MSVLVHSSLIGQSLLRHEVTISNCQALLPDMHVVEASMLDICGCISIWLGYLKACATLVRIQLQNCSPYSEVTSCILTKVAHAARYPSQMRHLSVA